MRTTGSVCLRWLAVFAFASALFIASELPPPQIAIAPFPYFDKLLHVAAYGVLAMLLFRALWADETRPTPTAVLVLAVVLATLYGVSDEFHQIFTGREFDVWDMAANGLGAAAAAALWDPITAKRPDLR
ncbi:MAG TPA: VanZ family protein [Planctomycetota bacterium]|nr:VanZ family protein [Planctomycetota bacterium]